MDKHASLLTTVFMCGLLGGLTVALLLSLTAPDWQIMRQCLTTGCYTDFAPLKILTFSILSGISLGFFTLLACKGLCRLFFPTPR